MVDKKELMTLSGTEPKLILNDEFKEMLNQMPEIIKKGNDLLEKDIDDLSEDDLNEVNKHIKEFTSYNTNIKKAKSSINNYFDTYKKNTNALFSEHLSNAGYDHVEKLATDIKQRKKDILQHRINKRWDDLKSTFDDNMSLYSEFFADYPELMDWSRYKVNHPDLVSGAKTKKITDAHRSIINNEINAWNNLISIINQNQWGLDDYHLDKLRQDFIYHPNSYTDDSTKLLTNAELYKKQQETLRKENEAKKAAEEKRKADEQKRIEELAKNQSEASKTKTVVDKEAEKPKLSNNKTTQASTDWLFDYIASTPAYRNMPGNDKVKCRFIFDLMMNIKNKDNNIITKNTKNDPSEIIKTIQKIINL